MGRNFFGGRAERFPLSFGREQDVKQKFQTVISRTGQWTRHDSG